MSDGRVALVTGASGNVGSAVAHECAAAGMAVAVHYRASEAAASKVVGDIANNGGRARAFAADLAGDGASDRAEELVAAVVAEFGRLDAVVANSAEQVTGEFTQLRDADWLAMFDANLLATTRLVRAALPVLQPGGSVVTVSSVEARAAFPRHAHYAASKAALESFTRSLALELGPRGMRANAVAPGLIDRPGLAEDWPEGFTWWQGSAPSGRPVTAEEVASAVSFLVGTQSTGINGAVLPVDGGWSASARVPF